MTHRLRTNPPRAAESAAAVGGVRPLRAEDLPALVDLRRRCFRFEAPAPPELVERDLRALFLDSPWRDPELPALVWEDATGRVTGFLGVMPRPMSLGGVPVRTAVTTRLMVDRDRGSIAALRLLQKFFTGPQDLSLADQATGGSRTLWERLGGSTAVLYSLDWFRPIAPTRAVLGYLAFMNRSAAFQTVSRSVGRVVDGVLTRLPGSPFRARPSSRFSGEALTEEALLALLEASTDAHALAPHYTPATLAWLLRRIEERLRDVRMVVVREGTQTIGWYAYGLNRHDVAQVVRLATAPRRAADVMRHLVADASAHGAVALLGRLEPRLLGEIDDPLCIFRRAPWVLVHSRTSAVLDAIGRGDAVLSRMEGEWWMPR